MKYEAIIEEIKDKVDIVDLISNYVELKKAGMNYKGLCPFHQEKTPSFTVNPSKQIFYCFGCHKGGDQISFIMAYENLSFNEAVVSLCEVAGIKPDTTMAGHGFKEAYYRINKEAARFYHRHLTNTQRAMEYFRSRSITDETIEHYELGYSPAERDSLFKYLTGQGFKEEDIARAGLVNTGKGQPYDFFRDRVMFPITDAGAKVLAFGGRSLSEQKGMPKYINSAENPVFKKGEAVYGIHRAKNAISQKGYSAVVEGYMDVLMSHQFGFLNVAAPLGTAITEAHLKKLKKYSNNILIVFDGDNPGISAAKRAVELAFSQSMNVKVALLPTSEDPDSLLRKQGPEALAKVFSRALSAVSFYFKLYGKNPVDCVRKTLSLLLLSDDKLQREEALKEVVQRSAMDELSLRHELDRLSGMKGRQKRARPESSKPMGGGLNKVEEYFLQSILFSPASVSDILRDLDLQYFNDQTVKGLLQKLKDAPFKGGKDFIEGLLNQCDVCERELILRLTIDESLDEAKAIKANEDCLKKITLSAIEKMMKEATQKGDIDLVNRLLLKKRELSMKIG